MEIAISTQAAWNGVAWRDVRCAACWDVEKRALIEQIVASLAAELEGYARSARSAHAEATDEQSKAENKYDTRGLEASYLARGQSRQAAETATSLREYQALEPRSFGKGEPIDVGAVVVLKEGSGESMYFLGPRAGGIEVAWEGHPIFVITAQSPLGQQLLG